MLHDNKIMLSFAKENLTQLLQTGCKIDLLTLKTQTPIETLLL